MYLNNCILLSKRKQSVNDSNYKAFWKKQNYGNRKRSMVFKGSKGRREG